MDEIDDLKVEPPESEPEQAELSVFETLKQVVAAVKVDPLNSLRNVIKVLEGDDEEMKLRLIYRLHWYVIGFSDYLKSNHRKLSTNELANFYSIVKEIKRLVDENQSSVDSIINSSFLFSVELKVLRLLEERKWKEP